MSTLYMVSTPIGNLEDLTLRALRILGSVSAVFCEDTRHTKQLLEHYQIAVTTITLHEHSGLGSYDKVISLLDSGNDVAYVTDAGTPGVSDPGGKLVDYVLRWNSETKIVPIPGASALTACLSIAGINLERFQFMGFPPVKHKRLKYFKEVAESKQPVIFYESTYRLVKSLEQLAEIDERLSVVVCGELTKKFEKVFRGSIKEVLLKLEKSSTKGEFVVLVYRGGLEVVDYEEE